ncbi:sulfite exporter TauE/SafE family protein [Synechococcus sp. A10-1-5-1]|uniref:sulfite exporter TauE/SafE family protein n=1 Tax=Synechococcus sp. A10-1-5-1 TaxID=2936507 RepID=UPI00200061E8|nr:sulfite exporter TauE/SafE family protein [Synechococcus sp. A10-1-5-1]UPM49446.1 sulfite exporter TauE/SafE family protein [Synechococcus sp. A10-1-5-1]
MTGLEPGLLFALGLIAFLYACVGHAGASGYIASLALFAVPLEWIRPMALVMNLVVASLASWRFYRDGHLPVVVQRRLLFPLLSCSIPAALLGGSLRLPSDGLSLFLAVVLLFSALRLWRSPQERTGGAVALPPWPVVVLTGAVLGLLAGLSGTGGGIFLTPLALLAGWLPIRLAAGVSSAFIWCNSLAGLSGWLLSYGASVLPPAPLLLAPLPLVALAGALGSWCGSRRFQEVWIRRLLALVLLLASLKLSGLLPLP